MPRFGRGRGDADRPERRGTPADALVIGLGNPGAEYERSRHNVGAEVVEVLAQRHHGALKKSKERALVTEVTLVHARSLDAASASVKPAPIGGECGWTPL